MSKRALAYGAYVLIAAVVAYGVFMAFGAYSGVDTQPPVCYNAWSSVVPCSRTLLTVLLPTFVVVLAALVIGDTALRRRAQRRKLMLKAVA